MMTTTLVTIRKIPLIPLGKTACCCFENCRVLEQLLKCACLRYLYRPTTTTFHLLPIIKEMLFRQRDRQSSAARTGWQGVPEQLRLFLCCGAPSPKRRVMEVAWVLGTWGMKWAIHLSAERPSYPTNQHSCINVQSVHVICHIMWV